MSFHRENIIWPSADGKTWNIGFFDCYQTGNDPEWDVEYIWNCFSWASKGHSSSEEACAAWKGVNPGGGTTVCESSNPELDKILEEYFRNVEYFNNRLPNR